MTVSDDGGRRIAGPLRVRRPAAPIVRLDGGAMR